MELGNLNAFWITDACYKNVGGKTRQFETLGDVYRYAVKSKLLEKDDSYKVHSIKDGGVNVPLEILIGAFAAGQIPESLNEIMR